MPHILANIWNFQDFVVVVVFLILGIIVVVVAYCYHITVLIFIYLMTNDINEIFIIIHSYIIINHILSFVKPVQVFELFYLLILVLINYILILVYCLNISLFMIHGL